MAYQVLARKYRPRSFSEMVGQSSILRALTNALKYKRIHHAYLFSGGHGIGKTSLARLLAKCLNCSAPISIDPCGQCAVCMAFDQGRFVDLVEVDGASRTKVEDTKELLDHVQYAPTMGRYKVYLIDEVHMLSTHSFNALLKTLEEPPPHIVFLLATTEPQRLPATVVSRCLQFHLKKLSSEQIVSQFAHILKQENISYEMPALARLAQVAHGSLRDGLSLLDQAIQYTNGQVIETEIREFLGNTQEEDRISLVRAMVACDATQMMTKIAQLAEKAVDFNQVLEDLLVDFHHIALYQMIPSYAETLSPEWIEQAEQLSQEEVQLYYQIALIGRRDLPLAPTPRLGFEMLMLRMMAFRPSSASENLDPSTKNSSEKPSQPKLETQALENIVTQANTNIRQDNVIDRVEKEGAEYEQKSSLCWESIVQHLDVKGMTHSLALHCVLESYEPPKLCLLLDPKHGTLHTQKQESYLQAALSRYLNQPIHLRIYIGNSEIMTPSQKVANKNQQVLREAQQQIAQAQIVQTLEKKFDAKIQPNSIKLIGETL